MNRHVGIILVNYNGFQETKECVESLMNIHYAEKTTIIVVDNASDERNDEIEAFLKENTVFIQSDSNAGFSAGNNIGIRYALDMGASYILLLNNDTVVEADFLTKLMEQIESLPKLGVAIGKILYFDRKDTLWYAGGAVKMTTGIAIQRGLGEIDAGQYDQNEEVGFVTGCMMLIPASVIEHIGMLDESFFLYAEDLEYSLRLQKHGYRMYYLPGSVIYHKVGASAGREETSERTQYYMVRNSYRAFFMYQDFFQKLCSILLNGTIHAKRILKREYTWRAVFKGYIDFLSGKMGKFESR